MIIIRHGKSNHVIISVSAAAVIAAGAIRYFQGPTFWLDEAFVALSLRHPSLQTIFAPLEYSQFFPRLYLTLIAAVRCTLGYEVWALRLLPYLSFVAGTLFWARLLMRRAEGFLLLGLMAGGLIIGAGFWLDQAIQLKQYTFDVMVALVPFLLGDEFFKERLAAGRRKAGLVLLALPCALSYTYPMALGSRVLGWYLSYGPRNAWRLRPSAVSLLGLSVALGLISIWATDHRFNLIASSNYLAYWNDCILRLRFEQGVGSTLQLIAKFLWGSHGRMPLVTAGMIPLQALGAYWIVSRIRKGVATADGVSWGSRSAGSLVLLAGVIIASATLNYPICTGRVVLFTQAHTQVLALEGALFIQRFCGGRRALVWALYIFIAVAMFHWGREYVRFARAEPAENLNPVISIMKAGVADSVWVHSCSVAQVRSLPDPLPVGQVQLATGIDHPERGKKTWVLWSHLGDTHCRKEMEQLRERASSWELVHEGPGRGLALAEF